ncbi:NAD-dependent epimerase/dehydratase family protein [Vibrio alginolyticus]|uniref:NAD-dependent epimerase/dehydratase family protein n=1 Tax=Vibrio sp. B1FLJ16 TaxID=2751178 RepID=UPI0015F78495|nr:NAD-dependent epimerase/dehydratase family protein [Vibrio sp. B1FLJ16]CAD7797753.1 Male sterility protein [Vibrio sp. B1FLJ16]CAE6880886.1 Male sterility protein [Vibrio sp. B1FLJ16]
MAVLITGATGFIGRHLVKQVADFIPVVRESETDTFKDSIVVSTIDDKTDWDGVFTNVDSIIHLAGIAHAPDVSSVLYKSVNVDGTLNLAKQAAIAGVRRFVYVSSIGVNGTATDQIPFASMTPEKPHNDYAQSKFDAELGLKQIAEETGLGVVIVRPTLVYGANAPGNFGMLIKIIEKLPMLPFGAADNKRDFIAVQNLCDLLVTCATHPNADGHTFLASDGETVSTKEFTNAIAEGLGKKVIQLPIPTSLIRLAGRLIGKSTMIEQLFGNLEVDSSNAKDVLGWRPSLNMKQAMATLRSSGNNK